MQCQGWCNCRGAPGKNCSGKNLHTQPGEPSHDVTGEPLCSHCLPARRGDAFHSVQEGIGGSSDVGSEQNYFEGGFIELNPQIPVLYIQQGSFPRVRLPAPARFLCSKQPSRAEAADPREQDVQHFWHSRDACKVSARPKAVRSGKPAHEYFSFQALTQAYFHCSVPIFFPHQCRAHGRVLWCTQSWGMSPCCSFMDCFHLQGVVLAFE